MWGLDNFQKIFWFINLGSFSVEHRHGHMLANTCTVYTQPVAYRSFPRVRSARVSALLLGTRYSYTSTKSYSGETHQRDLAIRLTMENAPKIYQAVYNVIYLRRKECPSGCRPINYTHCAFVHLAPRLLQ